MQHYLFSYKKICLAVKPETKRVNMHGLSKKNWQITAIYKCIQKFVIEIFFKSLVAECQINLLVSLYRSVMAYFKTSPL